MDESRFSLAAAKTDRAIRRFLFDHSLLLLAVALAAIVGTTFWYLRNLQERTTSSLAEQGARLELETIGELRELYTSAVVEKVRHNGIAVTHDYQAKENAIPLPATLTIELGERLGQKNSGLQLRLYSDYPFPWRKDGGPHDAFEREALVALRNDATQPFFRFEEAQGQRVLRYAVADQMRPACIACHNTDPASPKTDWKVGDVRGVLEVVRTVASLAVTAQADQQRAFSLIGVMGLLSLTGVGLVFGKQRRDAKELQRTALRLSAMDEASPVGTFVTDAQGYCLHLNQECRRITGYTPDLNSRTLWDAGIHPEDRERVQSQWQEATQQIGEFATEFRFVRGDGLTTWVSCKAAPMQSDRLMIGYAGTLEDIGDRKKVEQMKNEFVSTVSHELRTPLTSIMGALGLLAGGVGGELPGESKTLVDIARKNSERLVRLINDILDIEKIESGRMHFDLQPMELRPLLEQAIAANRAYAAQFGVTFKLDMECPEARAHVDADRFMQVMTNLMANAAKFSPYGGTVELKLSRQPSRVCIAVTDRGPGIPESFRDKIFSKFSQADSSDARQKGGTGLGLSITKAIIELMGGTIGFATQEGEGTTFYFDLPEWIEESTASIASIEPLALAQPASRPKILVCEDDRDVAALLSMMLRRAGYETEAAHDAASARRLLASGGFAAMTLDIKLPDVDGRAFLKELRADPATQDLAIIVVSGHLRQSRRTNEGDGLGVIDWIAKPIDESRLLHAVNRGAHPFCGKARVLHVEDDADVRHVISTLCSEIAEFDFAGTFEEAANLLAERRYELVILDLELPGRSGWDLLPLIDRAFPRPAVLVFSGTQLSVEDSSRVTATLVKSHVSNPELLDAVRTLTSSVHLDLT